VKRSAENKLSFPVNGRMDVARVRCKGRGKYFWILLGFLGEGFCRRKHTWGSPRKDVILKKRQPVFRRGYGNCKTCLHDMGGLGLGGGGKSVVLGGEKSCKATGRREELKNSQRFPSAAFAEANGESRKSREGDQALVGRDLLGSCSAGGGGGKESKSNESPQRGVRLVGEVRRRGEKVPRLEEGGQVGGRRILRRIGNSLKGKKGDGVQESGSLVGELLSGV